MSELNELRSEVARLRRAATRKISRIKTTHGAQVSGTEFDPRRPTGVPTHYTQKQLAAYKERLQQFLSRSNQFVPDASRQPIPRAEFREYKQQEAKYRETAGSVYERIKRTELPSGETIESRLARMTPMHKVMHGAPANSIFDPLTRESMDIVNRKALQKLTRSLKRGSTPEGIRRKVKDARQQLSDMLNTINSPELNEAVKKLSNNQFIALWNYTVFTAAISLTYANMKKMLTGEEESWAHDQVRQQMESAMEMVDWARRIKA